MNNKINCETFSPDSLEIDMNDIVPTITINDIFYMEDFKQRKLFLNEEICEGLTNSIARHIIQFNKDDAGKDPEDREPIRLYIYSPGGDLHAALSLIDTIELSKTPVIGYNMGEASSAAFLIMIACHERYCLKNSTSVVHRGSGVFAGAAGQIDSSVGYYKKTLLKIKDYILGRTSIDARTYKKRQDEDWFMDGADQEKYGIATILDNIDFIIDTNS